MKHDQYQTRLLGPLDVAFLTKDNAVAVIANHLETDTPLNIAFANTNLVTQAHRSPPVAALMKDFLILNDGIGLEIAARLFHKIGFLDNLNGTDFTPYLLSKLPKGAKVFLYGSKSHVTPKAAKALEKKCGIHVVGIHDGYTPIPDADLCEMINASGAKIVLVAKGNPLQEAWIAKNRAALKAPICIGVGALFDFVSGEFRRAPQWVQSIKMEWCFRLLNEPRRLAKRYTVDVFAFLLICRKYASSN